MERYGQVNPMAYAEGTLGVQHEDCAAQAVVVNTPAAIVGGVIIIDGPVCGG
jgi:hypothetical protein